MCYPCLEVYICVFVKEGDRGNILPRFDYLTVTNY